MLLSHPDVIELKTRILIDGASKELVTTPLIGERPPSQQAEEFRLLSFS